jgi:hypothetical protein
MALEDEVEELNSRLRNLEEGPAVIGDWYRLDAHVARTIIRAQYELTSLQRDLIELVRAVPPDPTWQQRRTAAQAIRDLVEELQMIRLAAQSRVFEHEAAVSQRDFPNGSRDA